MYLVVVTLEEISVVRLRFENVLLDPIKTYDFIYQTSIILVRSSYLLNKINYKLSYYRLFSQAVQIVQVLSHFLDDVIP